MVDIQRSTTRVRGFTDAEMDFQHETLERSFYPSEDISRSVSCNPRILLANSQSPDASIEVDRVQSEVLGRAGQFANSSS
jgi:hypothetical protein